MRPCKQCHEPLPNNLTVCPKCGFGEAAVNGKPPSSPRHLPQDRELKRTRSADLIEAFKLAIVFGLGITGAILGDRIGGMPGLVVGMILFFLVGLVTCFR